jgi:SufS family cysteine desulfurase
MNPSRTQPPAPRFSPEDPAWASLREEFPPLLRTIRPGVPLHYLDNAATTLKPRAVIAAVQAYDQEYPANVHRALHHLSLKATEAFEGARAHIAAFLNAAEPEEIVFTRGATEACNLVAWSFGQANLKAGDVILTSVLEHHSNLVPWQQLAAARGLELVPVPLDHSCRLSLEAVQSVWSGRVKLITLTAMSNVLGVEPPIAEIIRFAHAENAHVVIDAAQAVAHRRLDVQALDADFLALSGHKLFGPTGIGVLYAKRRLLERMPPWQTGGSMVGKVSLQHSTWTDIPWKFEAGTPPIAQAIGLGAAASWLTAQDRAAIESREIQLAQQARHELRQIDGVRILGPADPNPSPIIAFTVDGVHPHDLAEIADRFGVAIRAGHHCAMPLHEHLGIEASARASFAPYNNSEDVAALLHAVKEARRILTR